VIANALTRYRAVLLPLVAVLTSTSAARATNGVVVVGGSANEHDRKTVSAALETTVRHAGWTLPSKPIPKSDANGLLGCHDTQARWHCVPSSLTNAGVDHVLVAVVENKQAENGVAMVVVTAEVIITDVQQSAFRPYYCERCADDRLSEGSANLAQELLRDLEARSGHTMLSVRTVPPGAIVRLDGNPAGVTDSSFNTSPGKHSVIIEKAGFEREFRAVDLVEGKTTEVVVTLRASDGPVVKPRPSRAVPGAILGVGAAAVAAGVLLYATSESPSPSGGMFYTDTKPAGIVVGLSGVVAIGVGAYLWHRSTKRASAPTALMSRDGVMLGWNGAF
jgi:hypothetical protein